MNPEIPAGAVLDPMMEQVLADINVWWVIMPDGSRLAWNGNKAGPALVCMACDGEPEKTPNCEICVGRGVLLGVPFADRPWDEIIPNLWLGGHDCQPTDDNEYGDCLPGEEFDLVVSLFRRGVKTRITGNQITYVNFDPPITVVHLNHTMDDKDLDPEHHDKIDELAEQVQKAVYAGDKVLVRCQAGMNRSALVVGLTLIRMGWTADEVISRMREARSPYVLFNRSFVDYLRAAEARMAEGSLT